MKTVRLVTLFLLIGALSAAVVWALSTGQSIHYWYILAMPFIGLLLFSVWYAFLGWGTIRKRLQIAGCLLAVLLLAGLSIRYLTRYEGSVSGTSLPKLSWRWSKPEDKTANVETRVNEKASQPALVHEAAAASTSFMGHGGDGIWEGIEFSLDWEKQAPEELWRRPIGEGWSSFAVAQGRTFTQEQTSEGEFTLCLDLLTGREIWRHGDEGVRFVEWKMKEDPSAVMGGEGPRATPRIYRGKVFITGSTSIAKCLDFETGNLIWKRDLIKECQGVVPRWGKSNSPLILEPEGLVVYTGSETSGLNLIACELDSGDTRWTWDGKGSSYSTPRVLTISGVRQVVSVNAHDVTGHDPAKGTELWKFDWPGHYPKVGQPQLTGENTILVTASYGAGTRLIEVNHDSASGDWTARQVWKTKWMKTKFSSAVPHNGAAYGLDEGRLAAIDLDSGNILWKKNKYGFGQQLLVRDHLIIQAENGELILGRPGREAFEEKIRFAALSANTWNAPALAGRFLLVRNDREAACYLLPKETP